MRPPAPPPSRRRYGAFMFTARVRKDQEGYTLTIPEQEAARLGLHDGAAVTASLTAMPEDVRSGLDALLAQHQGSIPGDALHAWMRSHRMTTDEGYAAARAEMEVLISGHPQS